METYEFLQGLFGAYNTLKHYGIAQNIGRRKPWWIWWLIADLSTNLLFHQDFVQVLESEH